MAKRGNNEGSIIHRSDGRWMGEVSLERGSDGKQRRRYVYGRTRAEVAAKLDRLLSDVRDGVMPAPASLTVGRWLDTWLTTYAAPTIRASTWRQYEGMIRVHLKPAIGGVPLTRLQGAQVQQLLNAKGTTLAPRTVEIMHTVLHMALDQAVRDNLIPRNVADHSRKPKKSKPNIRVLTNDEMQRLLAAAAECRLGIAFVIMLGTGLRRGELVALHWDDVDLKGRTLRVTGTANRVRIPGTSRTRLVIQEPKTAASRRRIPLPPSTAAALAQWHIRQNGERLLAGSAWENTGLVVTTESGGMQDPQNINRQLNKLATRVDIPHVTVHALRHTYATRLLESGVAPKIVQELLGHTTIMLTLDIYTHVMPELKHAAADVLDSFLKPRSCQIDVKQT